MSRPVTIYGLCDVAGVIRYVGKTVVPLRKRLDQHRREARCGHKCPRCQWINAEHRRGNRISIVTIEVTTDDQWKARETFWISHHRALIGKRLTNCTDGGDGLHGHTFSDDHRKRIGDAHRGRPRSPELREKIAIALRGHKLSPEQIAKISAFHKGRKKSPEHRAKIAAGNLGKKHSPETIVKMSAANFGKHHSEASRRKMSEKRRGVPKSPEHRAAVIAAKLKYQRPVIQMKPDDTVVRKFDSVKSAAIAMEVYHHAITAALQSRNRTCKGFRWSYVNEETPTLAGD